jgi:SAM-dependent methyltransferase
MGAVPRADAYLMEMTDEWAAADLFNQDYLDFYLPRLSDDASDREAAVVWELLHLAADELVLDLACGHGRIANRLAARGAVVTGLDATPLFLERARTDAAAHGVTVDYVEGDMRTLPWADRFDAVVSWFTAYGYFDDDQNRTVLREVHRALRPGGRFLVELNHKDGLLPTWLPSTVEHSGEAIMTDERDWDPISGRSNNWRTIIRDGRVRRAFFFTRLFSFTELRDWLLHTGFRSVEGYADDGSPLTRTSRRMILVATK